MKRSFVREAAPFMTAAAVFGVAGCSESDVSSGSPGFCNLNESITGNSVSASSPLPDTAGSYGYAVNNSTKNRLLVWHGEDRQVAEYEEIESVGPVELRVGEYVVMVSLSSEGNLTTSCVSTLDS